MHQCLLVAEIQGRIIDHLEPSDALRLALTSKTFLEQSLDSIWQEISSFSPLIACLPSNLWTEEEEVIEDSDEGVVVLHLRRSIRVEDIRRYITYYAPRIRAFSLDISPWIKIPSADALRALELVTERRPGALSPLLKEFVWYDAEDACNVLGDVFAGQLSPHMHLFLGEHVEVLDASNSVYQVPDFLLHDAAVELSIKTSEAKLKSLTLSDADHILDCFQTFTWNRLETVTLSSVPMAVIPRLASLPRLEKLQILGFEGRSREGSNSTHPVSSGFQSLLKLHGTVGGISEIQHLLHHLQHGAPLQTCSWSLQKWDRLEEVQLTLETVTERCNALTLTSLVLWKDWGVPEEEPLDIDFPDQLDISSLFKFQNLTILKVKVMHTVVLTPEIIARIPIAWPRLKQLMLSPAGPTTHTTLITHKHILQLTLALPRLWQLGIQFDATRVTEQLEEGQAKRRSRLQILYVGNLPNAL